MVAIGVQMVVVNLQMLLDQFRNALQGGGLGDIDVTAHVGLKKIILASLQAPV